MHLLLFASQSLLWLFLKIVTYFCSNWLKRRNRTSRKRRDLVNVSYRCVMRISVYLLKSVTVGTMSKTCGIQSHSWDIIAPLFNTSVFDHLNKQLPVSTLYVFISRKLLANDDQKQYKQYVQQRYFYAISKLLSKFLIQFLFVFCFFLKKAHVIS